MKFATIPSAALVTMSVLSIAIHGSPGAPDLHPSGKPKPNAAVAAEPVADAAIAGCHSPDAARACFLDYDEIDGLKDCWPRLTTDRWDPQTCGVSIGPTSPFFSLKCSSSRCRFVVVFLRWRFIWESKVLMLDVDIRIILPRTIIGLSIIKVKLVSKHRIVQMRGAALGKSRIVRLLWSCVMSRVSLPGSPWVALDIGSLWAVW